MASNKEEPNASFLFGDSTGDDPFSQLQQQNAISEKPINQVNEEKNPTVNKQPKTLTGDTSNLFGSNSESNADMFFSSGMAASRSSNPPLTSNASAASFFDQPQSSDSFFDNLNQNPTSSLTQSFDYAQSQQQTPNPAVSLIQAYDPNPYTSNYNQQEQVQAEQQQQQQQQQQQHQYDQSQWIQFDPNVHYYYDEQGQVHYYDPNTNQEYDMSQYGYDEQGQNYEYQYDPQYADYYNQQGYDPNTYAATNDNTSVYNNQQQQTYTPSQDNYDSNAYAPAAITQQSVPATAVSSQSYYDPNQYTSTTYGSSEQVQQQAYNPQAYASVSSAIAEVPAQVQSEQTIDTQSYLPEQQEQFGIQNYASAEFSNQQVQQTQEYSYQAYNSSNISHSNDLQQDKNEQDQYVPVDYTSTDANQTYSQIQTDFEEEDLQQKSHDTTSFEPAPKNPILSSPKSAPSSQDIQNPHSSAEVLVPSTYSSQRGSFDGRSEQQQGEESSKQAENLDDLDDLVLGGSSGQQKPLDNSDSLMAAADYDRHVEETSSYTQLNSFEEGQSEKESLGNKQTEDESVSQHNNQNMPQLHLQTEPIIFSSEVPSEISSDIADEPKQRQTEAIEIQQPEDLASIEPENKFEKISSEPQSDESEKKDEQIVNDTYNDESAATKGGDTRLVGTNEPVQDDAQQFQQTAANEPEQSVTFDSSNFALQFDQFASVESYQPVQYESEQGTTENKTMLNSEPQSGMVDHESQPAAVNYESQTNTTYEPYVPNYYEHAQTTNYEPEQTISYEPEQITSYEPEQTTSYEPQQNISYEPQQNISYQQPNNYQPQQAVYPPPTSVSRSGMSDYSQTAEQLQRVTSPPHSGSIKSMTPPPLMHNIQSLPYQPLSSQQRSNSITETDRRRHSGSPFSGYNNNQFTIERSATVPPPITDRVVSPRPQLIPCPDPNCEGENKPKAKFCCECGQPLTSLSRSTTPSINMSINQFGVESFNPISSSLGAVTEQVQRSALDDKKDAMVQKFKEFIDVSVVVNNERDVEEKRKHALEYISGCIDKFEDESKALLWRLVKLMLEHHEHTLGDGGQLDKSIIELISNKDDLSSNTDLDKLEGFLYQGDRKGACQFASEKDMWAHALIIASSVEGVLFKRIVSQFIDRELFSATTELVPQLADDKKALRMLYSVFNSAGVDAVSEFVKQTKDEEPLYSVETLKNWQHALALVLANRSSNDQEAIFGLGNRLKEQGSMNNEARLCYMLSPDKSGLDNNKIIGDDIYTDLDSLYLAEFYEFASNAGIQQDFKLVLAWWLTELGFTQESQRYCDSIVSTFQNNPEYVTRLESLKRLGEIGPITNESDSVTSLLTKQSFDTLIGSVKEKLSSTSYTAADDQTSNTAPDYSGQVSTEYNYGYGNSYTAPSDTIPHSITSPFVQQAKGIRSPFQDNKDLSTSDQHIKSPFQSNVHPVSSPFGVQSYGESVQPTNDSQGAWWDSNHAQTSMLNDQPQESYQSYEPQVNITTSYEPDTTAGTKTSWDEDDDLGFGNSSTKKDPAVSNDPVVDNKESETNEEKPEKEDAKKEKERHGWGLFSLFGRKEKETADEKKAIKANLGDQNNFYYDEKEKRWVNKLNDSKPAAATPPPPPKASTPQPTMMTPPASGLKPNSMPPPRINSAPPVGAAGEPPSAFNTPPPSNRRAGAGRKPMRSRYVDVLNTKN